MSSTSLLHFAASAHPWVPSGRIRAWVAAVLAVGVGVAASAPVAAALPPACGSPVASGPNSVVTCAYTGAVQSFTVPEGVPSVTLEVKGASGGALATFGGGSGGEESGDLSVTAGEVLTVLTGSAGGNNSGSSGGAGGLGGGAQGANSAGLGGGGGGGGSFVYDGSEELVLAAGGGGGSGGCASEFGPAGGAGGGEEGETGGCGVPEEGLFSGRGGSQSAGGAGGNEGGGAGGGPAGFAAGEPKPGVGGTAGGNEFLGGGGGGGGYFGGGGGGDHDENAGGGSGYRSSSISGGAASVGGNEGNGVVTITYPTPTPPSITSADSASFTVGDEGSFQITTSGAPTASISDGGATLPSGVSFVDNGNGTATLSGIPQAGSGGAYRLTFTASNGLTPDAKQSFTLRVTEPCPAPVWSGTSWVVTCPYTGALETFSVPVGYSSLALDVKGAAGGVINASASAGKGGEESGSLAVTAGEVLTILAGGAGGENSSTSGGAGGFGGGANGANGSLYGGAGGGGGSFVYNGSDELVLAAGGGGGFSGCVSDAGGTEAAGGAGGGTEGGAGVSCPTTSGGGGGTQTAGGSAGGEDGGPSGGVGGGPATFAAGEPVPGSGGAGGGSGERIGGGGGGGGYFGGGGGYVADAGGGSGYRAPSISGGGATVGGNAGNGVVTITYTPAAPGASILAPASNGFYAVGQVVETSFGCSEATGGPGLESCDDSDATNTANGGSGHLDTSTLGTHTYSVTASSHDGQSGTASISYTVAEAPSASISLPAVGASYTQGQTLAASYSCTEGADGPGIAACSGSVADGAPVDTSSVGTHVFRVLATSKDAMHGEASVTYNVAPAPTTRTSTSSTFASPSSTAIAPVITHLTQSHPRWREGSGMLRLSLRPHRKAKHEAPVGTTFSFSLNEPAGVELSFSRRLGGRRQGTRCVPRARMSHPRVGCTRTLASGSLSFAGHSGVNDVLFEGRTAASLRLRPGNYLLTVTAANGSGRSRPVELAFTIVR